jgi:hypothetical protein
MKTGDKKADARHTDAAFLLRQTGSLSPRERAGVRGRARWARHHVHILNALSSARQRCLELHGQIAKIDPAPQPSAVACRVKFPRSISGFRTFGFSRLMDHSAFHEESRGIDGGLRPEITKARNDESPKKCYHLHLPRLSEFGNRGVSNHRGKLAKILTVLH